MQPILAADLWLIEHIFEPIGWRCEYYFKKDCFFLARLCGTVAIVIFAATDPGQVKWVVWPIIWLSFNMLIGLTRESLRANPQHLNSFKARPEMRFFIFSVALLNFYEVRRAGQQRVILECLAQANILISVYFLACNSLPPGWKPKELEWLKSLHPQPRLQPV
jgi:hypothetical protein